MDEGTLKGYVSDAKKLYRPLKFSLFHDVLGYPVEVALRLANVREYEPAGNASSHRGRRTRRVVKPSAMSNPKAKAFQEETRRLADDLASDAKNKRPQKRR